MKSPRRQSRSVSAPRRANATPSRFLQWFSDRRTSVLFVAKFAGILIVFHALSLSPWFERCLPFYLQGVAWVANGFARLFGVGSQVTGSTLYSAAFGVTVSRDCSGIEFVCFIAAVIVAFPATWRARLAGILLAIGWCALLNVLRVASLLFVGTHAPRAFDLMHEELWSIGLIAASTLFVAGWIHWLAREPEAALNRQDGCAAT
jgi:exosortase/archaeosortase family protein